MFGVGVLLVGIGCLGIDVIVFCGLVVVGFRLCVLVVFVCL